ncbi:MAG TPA: hypothetical protein VMV69_15440 [Pirellulales bacterium]|nr:hypothetical protein [Pirellulales bacterium]
MKLNACSGRPWLGQVTVGCLTAALLAATLGGCAGNRRARSSKGLGSWFRANEPRQSKTMADFLKQPRPDF